MFNRTLAALAALFLFVGIATAPSAQAQGPPNNNASHNVTVTAQSFAFIGPGNSGVLPNITLEVDGTPDPNADIAQLTTGGNVVSITNEGISSGQISATVATFKLVYGTNSQNTQKILVSADSDFDLGGDPVNVNADAISITGLPNGGNKSGVPQTGVPVNSGDANFVNDIDQGGGTVNFEYTFDLDRFANPGTVSRTVTYTITAN